MKYRAPEPVANGFDRSREPSKNSCTEKGMTAIWSSSCGPPGDAGSWMVAGGPPSLGHSTRTRLPFEVAWTHGPVLCRPFPKLALLAVTFVGVADANPPSPYGVSGISGTSTRASIVDA